MPGAGSRIPLRSRAIPCQRTQTKRINQAGAHARQHLARTPRGGDPSAGGHERHQPNDLLRPKDARELLEHIAHKRPDSIRRKDVDMLDEMMMRDEFMAGNRITLAVNDDGDPVLVDGSNMLRAAVVAKWSAGRSVRIPRTDHAEDVYITVDSVALQRSPAVIGRAVGRNQLPHRTRGAIILATRCLNAWKPSRPTTVSSPRAGFGPASVGQWHEKRRYGRVNHESNGIHSRAGSSLGS